VGNTLTLVFVLFLFVIVLSVRLRFIGFWLPLWYFHTFLSNHIFDFRAIHFIDIIDKAA